MMRRACAVVVVALFGCGDDGGGGSGNGSDGGTGSDAANGSDSGGGGTQLLTGTSCEGAVSYTLRGDEKVTLYTDPTTGMIKYIFVKDGPVFNFESEPAWGTYAATHDTYLMLVFQAPEPFTVHTTSNDAVYSSLFGGRDTGLLTLAGGPLNITAIDTSAKTISVTFTLVVTSSTTGYPPVFAAVVDCFNTTPGSITGGFSGTYDVMQF